MDNTMKLLRAFIEASGFDIEDNFIEPVDVEVCFDEGLAVINGFGANNLLVVNGKYKRGDDDSYFRRIKDVERDYKVTKTKLQKGLDDNVLNIPNSGRLTKECIDDLLNPNKPVGGIIVLRYKDEEN